jgi:CDP-6-deoxy-D-xylo-4-hexulose-3-dehydrase
LLAPGDEVLIPALTWSTTVWPVMQLGLVPVLVDIDQRTLAMDLASAQTSLSSKTKALFLVHVLGQIPEMEPIIAFCKKNGLLLLEDVCESMGAWHRGTHAGNFGLMASFSCYFSHHISTVEGGVIITSDEALYNDLVSMRSHGWIRGPLGSRRLGSALPRSRFALHVLSCPATTFVPPISRGRLGKFNCSGWTRCSKRVRRWPPSFTN